ncbi:hypothetical protein NSQ59_18475 [Margalitia sp. FSL K6-0131]|uniref:hypothetical protein n=1 Tax=Margalitia sp. FSL K6-0131 TaxID=2954604 RepID=UPI0030FA4A37
MIFSNAETYKKYYLPVNIVITFLLIWSLYKLHYFHFFIGIIYFSFIIYQIFFLYRKKGDFNSIRFFFKIMREITFCLWFSTAFIYFNTTDKVWVWLNISLWFLILAISYQYIRIILNTWWKYLILFFCMFFINFFIAGLGLIILQEAYKISDRDMFTIIYVLTIFIPILLTSLETDELRLKVIKVAIYAWVALITSLSTIVFLIKDDVEKFIYKDVILNELNIRDERHLEDILKNKKNVEQFEKMINEMNLSEKITLRGESGSYLSSKEITRNIILQFKEQSSAWTEMLFSLFFLPHIIGGVWCTFVVELKEKYIFFSDMKNKNI